METKREIVRPRATLRVSRRHRHGPGASVPLVARFARRDLREFGADALVGSFVYIAPAKVRDYLLDPGHAKGGSKAKFFQILGYSRLAWRRLEQDLRGAHDSWRMRSESRTDYGDVYRLVSEITGPNGRSAFVLTVWIIREGEPFSRLVTAHPGKAR